MRARTTTLAQLPKRAADYYVVSIKAGVFTYEQIDQDDAGRRVYQRYLDDKPYGYPKALLTYAEFKTNVKRAHAECPTRNVGVQRWCRPYYRNDSRVGPLDMFEDPETLLREAV